MMYGWWDNSLPWFGMLFGPIMMIAFIVVTIVVVAWVLRAMGLGRRFEGRDTNTPLDTLKHRFARGEIDRTEYEERKKILGG